jgi:hypothetical protein
MSPPLSDYGQVIPAQCLRAIAATRSNPPRTKGILSSSIPRLRRQRRHGRGDRRGSGRASRADAGPCRRDSGLGGTRERSAGDVRPAELRAEESGSIVPPSLQNSASRRAREAPATAILVRGYLGAFPPLSPTDSPTVRNRILTRTPPARKPIPTRTEPPDRKSGWRARPMLRHRFGGRFRRFPPPEGGTNAFT